MNAREERLKTEWIAEQMKHFRPGDMDAGIAIIRRAMQRRRREALEQGEPTS